MADERSYRDTLVQYQRAKMRWERIQAQIALLEQEGQHAEAVIVEVMDLNPAAQAYWAWADLVDEKDR